MELGGWFRKIKDPILLEFLKVWGKIEVEGQNRATIQDELVERYRTLERQFHEYKGYLGEMFMSQVLLNGQQKVLPGRLFHSQEDVQMPWPFFFVRHRVRLSSGKEREIDLLGAAAGEVWIGQSKWVTRDKIGSDVLQNLMTQAELVKEEMGDRKIRKWLFAYSGLTREAEQFAQKHDILWSSHEELNALLRHLGLRELPDFEPE